MKVDRGRAVLLVVDVQEAFRKVIDGFEEVVDAIGICLQAAALLEIPAIVTEQYPRGLGGTVAELSPHLGGGPRLEKTVLAATGAPGFDLAGRDQVLLCGIEAHICVHQTAAALTARGVDVHLLADAVSSRTAMNREIGIARTQADGAHLSSVELAFFDCLGDAADPSFRGVQRLFV